MERTSPKSANLPAGTVDTPAAARIVGMHWRTLLRWIERGMIAPECYFGEPGTTSSAYAWRIPDLMAGRTLVELRAAGLSAQKVRRAARVVMKETGRDLSACRLWSDGKDAFRVLSGERLVSVLLKPGQHLLFDLGTWAQVVQKRFDAELRRRERTAC